MPNSYFDEKGIEHKIANEEVTQTVIKDKFVIEIPHSAPKWVYHLKRKDPLDPQKCREDLPYFLPELDMIFEGGGSIHRTSEAFVNGRDGSCKVKIMDIRPLFEHIKTDGAHWYSIHDGKKIDDVGDYRLAIVFWIRQKEFEVEAGKEIDWRNL